MKIPFKAVAVDMDGTFLNDQRSYDHQLFDQVLTKLEKHDIRFIVASGRPFARLKNDFPEFIDRMDFVTANGSRLIVEGKKESTEISDWQKLPDDVFIELTFHYDSKIAKDIEQNFNEQYGNLVTTFASNPIAIDAVKYGINKATGLKNLLARFNSTSEDLIAFGDSGNDIQMLDFAKYSYAMENGMEIAKEHARYLAPSNNDNGVLQVLNRYLDKN